MFDLAMSRMVVRDALSNLLKAERLLKEKVHIDHRGKNEIFIEKPSEELFNACCEVFEANKKFYNFCKNKAETDFGDVIAESLIGAKK